VHAIARTGERRPPARSDLLSTLSLHKEHPSVTTTSASTARALVNKVPEITVFFWLIKVMATTVGETAADYLNENLGLGLTVTTYLMTGLFLVALVVQFRTKRYVPVVYWVTVVLISIVGTLITDNLTDKYHVALELTTTVFAVALAATFLIWYREEHTLSIHSISTPRREAFYWLAILCTFALGTAAGDLIAERFNAGYWKSAVLFAGCIAAVYLAWKVFHINEVLAFWIAYILTRPLGASVGDFLSQPTKDGGQGLGTTATSVVFLSLILVVVVFLTITKRDQVQPQPDPAGAA
jgi:uncharacterized membrane-anchored protein